MGGGIKSSRRQCWLENLSHSQVTREKFVRGNPGYKLVVIKTAALAFGVMAAISSAEMPITIHHPLIFIKVLAHDLFSKSHLVV